MIQVIWMQQPTSPRHQSEPMLFKVIANRSLLSVASYTVNPNTTLFLPKVLPVCAIHMCNYNAPRGHNHRTAKSRRRRLASLGNCLVGFLVITTLWATETIRFLWISKRRHPRFLTTPAKRSTMCWTPSVQIPTSRPENTRGSNDHWSHWGRATSVSGKVASIGTTWSRVGCHNSISSVLI